MIQNIKSAKQCIPKPIKTLSHDDRLELKIDCKKAKTNRNWRNVPLYHAGKPREILDARDETSYPTKKKAPNLAINCRNERRREGGKEGWRT